MTVRPAKTQLSLGSHTNRTNEFEYPSICMIKVSKFKTELNSAYIKYMSQAMKKCVMSYVNNKGADQPAHPCSLSSAFIVRCLDSIISLDSIAEISRL